MLGFFAHLFATLPASVGFVVTIGGVAAIAVSLAAQNLIRDVVSGLLVLAEDQFVVGDFVTINGASGLVERLTLRIVQLRGVAGSLVTISHSASTSVVGVDALSRDGVIIRARIRTAPLRQFALQRELNFRISRAFGEPRSASVRRWWRTHERARMLYAQIAARVRFSSQSRFAQMFSRYTGLTPSAYRSEQLR
jgi:small-conductance mechanosensitive channel